MNYLLKVTNVYRVPTVEAALALREELAGTECGELISFSYTTKQVKQKGEIIDEFQVCKATIEFNKERDPESRVIASYEVE